MKNILIVMGSAPCLKKDLIAAKKAAAQGFDLMAINTAGTVVMDQLKFWASYHPVQFFEHDEWLAKRQAMGGNMDMELVSHRSRGGRVHHLMEYTPPSGSSALLGVLFGLTRYESVLVAGVPLQGQYVGYQAGWLAVADQLKGRVRSMSGWTKTFLEGLNRA